MNKIPLPNVSLQDVERLREGGVERENFIALDRNERLESLPESFINELREAVTSSLLTSYPISDLLYEDLAKHLNVDRGQVLLTPGSDAAVRAIHQTYIEPGDGTLMLSPSYAMYPIYGKIFAAHVEEVFFNEKMEIDVDFFLEKITRKTKVIFLANPNQPTGTKLDQQIIHQIIEKAERNSALVVIDEAYFPFSGSTSLPLLAQHKNLIVLRTFSKAWGLAGLRIGFVVAHREIIKSLYKVRSAYDVNAAAIAAARICMKNPDVAADYVATVNEGRKELQKKLREIGFTPLEGKTNFQIFRLNQLADPEEVSLRLRNNGILVRGPFSAVCLQDCLRVTVGPPNLMKKFSETLEKCL